MPVTPPLFVPAQGPLPATNPRVSIYGPRPSGTDTSFLRYTTDGSDPTLGGTLVNNFIANVIFSVSPTRLRAIAIYNGVNSPITDQTYTFPQTPVPTPPTFDPVPGGYPTYPLPVIITAPDNVRGVKVIYTTDGTPPTPTNGTQVPGQVIRVVLQDPGITLLAMEYIPDGNIQGRIGGGLYYLQIIPPPPPPVVVTTGGLQFKDAAPMVAGVVDNGVCSDDPRVLIRLNEATKVILDHMIPVGGMITAKVRADNGIVTLPPEFENIIEAYPDDPSVTIRGDIDIAQAWYEIVNQSVYLDPTQHHDNPLIDHGLVPDPNEPSLLRRSYEYPGLSNPNAVIVCTGAKRYVPLTSEDDYLIVQNIAAIKSVILYIERKENNAIDEAEKFLQDGMRELEAEVKKHILDPRNYMRRKSAYQDDTVNFPENTLGWVRANIALDIDQALKTGKIDLTWSINQVERRLMKSKIWKDCIIEVQANVVGGFIYFPLYVGSVLAVNLDGAPIPIRSQFFEHLDNGPGMFATHSLLKDCGDEYFPSTQITRRKYKLVASCTENSCINAVCKVRWILKKPGDLMTIKNYEAIRLMMTSKFLEEKEDWNNAQVNQKQAFQLLEDELREYLEGIRHTVHVQTYGFSLGDVGGYWRQ